MEQLGGGAMNPRTMTTSSRGDSPSSLPLDDITGRGHQKSGDIIVHVPLRTLWPHTPPVTKESKFYHYSVGILQKFLC